MADKRNNNRSNPHRTTGREDILKCPRMSNKRAVLNRDSREQAEIIRLRELGYGNI